MALTSNTNLKECQLWRKLGNLWFCSSLWNSNRIFKNRHTHTSSFFKSDLRPRPSFRNCSSFSLTSTVKIYFDYFLSVFFLFLDLTVYLSPVKWDYFRSQLEVWSWAAGGWCRRAKPAFAAFAAFAAPAIIFFIIFFILLDLRFADCQLLSPVTLLQFEFSRTNVIVR